MESSINPLGINGYAFNYNMLGGILAYWHAACIQKGTACFKAVVGQEIPLRLFLLVATTRWAD